MNQVLNVFLREKHLFSTCFPQVGTNNPFKAGLQGKIL
ncbi:hypothetical protein EV03_0059 [Prochlorococcus marinus str. PAC1]|uniref:Uncharacterized protein n=1 Tax=Prochlorococcus marinus str. PAC1 TaxID=59924 RepID=A0A0A2CBV0_PROMR|nr:hypothetical protein EV03_0059 [Prochlorococcus marinus str. PAC1]